MSHVVRISSFPSFLFFPDSRGTTAWRRRATKASSHCHCHSSCRSMGSSGDACPLLPCPPVMPLMKPSDIILLTTTGVPPPHPNPFHLGASFSFYHSTLIALGSSWRYILASSSLPIPIGYERCCCAASVSITAGDSNDCEQEEEIVYKATPPGPQLIYGSVGTKPTVHQIPFLLFFCFPFALLNQMSPNVLNLRCSWLSFLSFRLFTSMYWWGTGKTIYCFQLLMNNWKEKEEKLLF